jgi:hypothetical protein
LKERTKELLQIQVFVPPGRSATAFAKFFWFFSSEKNTFLLPAVVSERHQGLVSGARREAPDRFTQPML